MTCGKKREERKTRKKGLDELLAPKRGISFPDLIFFGFFSKRVIYGVDLVPAIQSLKSTYSP